MKKIFTEEHRGKLTLANIKSWQDPITREKRLKSLRFKGKKHTEDAKQKIGFHTLGKTYEELYGEEKAKELKVLRSIQMKENRKTNNTLPPIIPWNKGVKYSNERKQQMSQVAKDSWKSEERRAKGCLAAQLKWQDSSYREKQIKHLANIRIPALKSLRKRPTSFEQRFIELCSKYELNYKYVGNGEIYICYRNPDFINTNGCKIIIETYYSKLHPLNYESSRYNIFRKYGYETLFLDENNLLRKDYEQHCLKKVVDFEQKYSLQHIIQ